MSRLSLNIFNRQGRYESLPAGKFEEQQLVRPKGQMRQAGPAVRPSNALKVPTAQGLCQRARPAELMQASTKRSKSGKRH